MSEDVIYISKGLQKEVLYKGLPGSYINYAIYTLFIALFICVSLSYFIAMINAMIVALIFAVIILSILFIYSKMYGASGYKKKIANDTKPNKIKCSNAIDSLLIYGKDSRLN